MRALITGASGFVAGHLARELASAGWDVAGSGIGGTGLPADFASHFSPPRILDADVTDPQAVRSVLAEARPDAVFHLAGIASLAEVDRDPVAAFRTNSVGALILLNELLRLGRPDTVCLIVGSAEQYGRHDAADMPLVETAELRPQSAYAASKCAQETIALQMHRARGSRVVCVRSFNHSGAGQDQRFVLPTLVSRALDLRKTGGRGLPVGNITPVRDFLHVEDVVRAYRLLVERGRAGEVYNVSSGEGRSIAAMARVVLQKAGVEAVLEEKPELMRAVDIPVLVGSAEKLERETGWRPGHTFDDIVEDLIFAATE